MKSPFVLFRAQRVCMVSPWAYPQHDGADLGDEVVLEEAGLVRGAALGHRVDARECHQRRRDWLASRVLQRERET